MDLEDDNNPLLKEIVVGADLSKLSVEELKERVAALKAEIVRIEADMAAKHSSRAAADFGVQVLSAEKTGRIQRFRCGMVKNSILICRR